MPGRNGAATQRSEEPSSDVSSPFWGTKKARTFGLRLVGYGDTENPAPGHSCRKS